MSTSPSSRLSGLTEAFEAAEAELGLGESSVDSETPVLESESPPTPEVEVSTEQPADEATEQVPTKLSDLVMEDKPLAPSLADDTTVEVPGEGELTLQELKDSYLRRRDYTQKTQEVADQRRALDEIKEDYGKAVDLFEMLKKDTKGTIAQLAFEAGLIDQQGLTAAGSEAPQGLLASVDDTEEKLAQLVQERVQQVLGTDPTIQELRTNQRVAQLNSTLDGLANTYGVPLDDADKIAIANQAVALQEPNLELVFLRMQHQLEDAKAEKNRIREAGGARRSVPAPKKTDTSAKSIREAWDLAEQSLAKGG